MPARRALRSGRRWAGPIVVTAFLAPGCETPSKPPPAPPAPPEIQGTASPEAASPAPEVDAPESDAQKLRPAFVGPGTWVEVGNGDWRYDYEEGGQLYWNNQEVCVWTPHAGRCPPGAMCNPPPPQQVKCPDVRPSSPKQK